MMTNFASHDHLFALQNRLSNEKGYLENAKSEAEIALRKVWIVQIIDAITNAVWRPVNVQAAIIF